jgi:hypothetical protein
MLTFREVGREKKEGAGRRGNYQRVLERGKSLALKCGLWQGVIVVERKARAGGRPRTDRDTAVRRKRRGHL